MAGGARRRRRRTCGAAIEPRPGVRRNKRRAARGADEIDDVGERRFCASIRADGKEDHPQAGERPVTGSEVGAESGKVSGAQGCPASALADIFVTPVPSMPSVTATPAWT